jgi:hypothetical protein
MSSLADRIVAQAVADEIVARLLSRMPELELLRIVELAEAARLSSLSPDQLTRDYPDLIVKLSTRRRGKRVCHCLMLSKAADIAD